MNMKMPLKDIVICHMFRAIIPTCRQFWSGHAGTDIFELLLALSHLGPSYENLLNLFFRRGGKTKSRSALIQTSKEDMIVS